MVKGKSGKMLMMTAGKMIKVWAGSKKIMVDDKAINLNTACK